jgi:hypothetical protein
MRWIVTVVALLAGVFASHAQARGLTTGFSADPALTNGTANANNVWIPRAVSEGAGMVRINVSWSQVAPATRPAGFDPSNSASPGYNWAPVDSAVRQLSSHGVQVLLNMWGAPDWAEGPNRPASVRDGTWEPSASEFGAFVTAAAHRYSGTFPDPQNPGQSLPRVRYWQPWNEPNLSFYLTPQWQRVGNHFNPVGPAQYRSLLNAAYAAVKAVSSSNFVVTAGTAPYGDPPGGQRIPPVAFDRDLMCLKGAKKLKPVACPVRPHFDAISNHPYGIGGPLWHALNPDDAAVADEYKIANVVKAAVKAHHVVPKGPKRLWVTEISWDSNPPDPQGIPINQHARWYEQAMWELWRQGVDTVLWLQIVDSPPNPSYGATYQAGLYFTNGSPKPAATAFRFPFVTHRIDRKHIQVWGRAPQGGTLVIKRQHGGVVKRMHVRPRQVFVSTVRMRGKVVLEAQVGSQTSLPWTQG